MAQDELTLHRKRRLRALLQSKRFNGSQAALATAAALTEGRITQLLDEGDSFGERAAKKLALKLGLDSERYFEEGFLATQDDNTPPIATVEFDLGTALDVFATAAASADIDARTDVAGMMAIFLRSPAANYGQIEQIRRRLSGESTRASQRSNSS